MYLLQLLKSKTVLFAIALAALSVVQGYVGLLPLTQIEQMYVGIVISVIVTVLRIITTQPLDQK
jgi:ABC-type branched-subunit amino acid transport system permease subunit